MSRSDRATVVNPAVLRWAREQSGLTLAEVGSRLNKRPSDIKAWETGQQAPTFVQLESLAQRIYKRPVGIFFFPEPPEEEPLENEFRTLPEVEIEHLPSEVRLQLRRAKAFVLSLKDLTDGINPSSRKIWRDLDASPEHPVSDLASRVREYLGIDLDTQRRWQDTRSAMHKWRNAVQKAGLFVFKHPFGTERVSGFCLYDQEFPIIMVNNQNTFTRQIFTLFHELAHILFGLSGVTPEDLTYADRIANRENQQIEIAANELAAEILVPSHSFPLRQLAQSDTLIESVEKVAAAYKVSREVIMRRLLDAGVVDRSTYLEQAEEWSSQRSHSGTGGNYYYNQATYLGDAFLELAFGRYDAGLISIGELADHLDMNARTVEKFESVVLSR